MVRLHTADVLHLSQILNKGFTLIFYVSALKLGMLIST